MTDSLRSELGGYPFINVAGLRFKRARVLHVAGVSRRFVVSMDPTRKIRPRTLPPPTVIFDCPLISISICRLSAKRQHLYGTPQIPTLGVRLGRAGLEREEKFGHMFVIDRIPVGLPGIELSNAA